MKLEELMVHKLSMIMAEDVWQIVIKWDYFSKETIGKQLIRAVDSVAANLSEDFGRFHFKENINFSYYSRGSLFETKTWLTKANNRQLLTDESYSQFVANIDDIGIKLNNYIKSIGKIK
jgi:four helix bundle protein